MTNQHSPRVDNDLENSTYPAIVSNADLYHVAEDADDYVTPIRLRTKSLKAYLRHRLEERAGLPNRLHMVIEDIQPLLDRHKDIDVFDLIAELILLADKEPARYLSALMAALDDDALIELEPRTIAESGAFIHDAMQGEQVRWDLEHYHDEQKELKKERKQQKQT